MRSFVASLKRILSRGAKAGPPFALLLLLADFLRPAVPFRVQAEETRRPAEYSKGLDNDVFRRIEALVASHEFDEAEKVLKAHMPPGAAAAPAYFRMGKVYFEHQEWSRAAEFLQKSLRLESGNDQAHFLLGLAWREVGDQEKAEAELLEAARERPKNNLNVFMAGHQLLIEGKYDAALGYLYKAVELNPRQVDALRALGMAQARLGNYGLAENYFRRAIEVSGASKPDAFPAYVDLAYLLTFSHDPARLAEGLRSAQLASQLQPSSSVAHYLVGKALLKSGRLNEAVKELQQAENLDPQDGKPHFLLAQAFERLGKEAEAKIEREALAKSKKHRASSGMASGGQLPWEQE